VVVPFATMTGVPHRALPVVLDVLECIHRDRTDVPLLNGKVEIDQKQRQLAPLPLLQLAFVGSSQFANSRRL